MDPRVKPAGDGWIDFIETRTQGRRYHDQRDCSNPFTVFRWCGL